jgi:uncharacterized membrane protein YccC
MNTDEQKRDVGTGDISSDILRAWGLGIVGAIAGAVVGWFVYGWIASVGFYALALPGALVGLGFGALSRRHMILGGVFCAVVAFFLTAACEWRYSPFEVDESFGYFLTHIHKVDSPMTLILLALGVGFAFWFGRGR